MAADDQVTSLTGLGSIARNGNVAFSTTNWSVVLEAQGESPAAKEALEKLCRTNGVHYGDLRLDPTWDPLRGDPRFEKIVASLGPNHMVAK